MGVILEGINRIPENSIRCVPTGLQVVCASYLRQKFPFV